MIKSVYISKLSSLMIIGGGKRKSEGIVAKCFKKLQKKSIKQPYELLQTTVKHLTPVFRFQVLTSKKSRQASQLKKKTAFILSPSYRLTLALKYLVNTLKSQKSYETCGRLEKEIITTCELSSITIKKTLEDQKQVFLYKRSKKVVRKSYRWANTNNQIIYV
jgi:ribosomal protein S7